MVFQNQRRRKGATQAKAIETSKTSVVDLPDEILFTIFEYADTNIITEMRQTCHRMAPVCATIISKRLTTLYIHPSPKALKNAVAICHHPVFSQEIEEVVLLGKAQWDEIRKTYPRYRSHGECDDLDSNDFMTWPATGLGLHDDARDRGITKEAVLHPTSPAESYKPLIDALTALPKLHKLVFAQRVEKPGLNQISEKSMTTHLEICNIRTFCYSDAEMFYRIFLSPNLGFTNVRFGVELPWAKQALSYISSPDMLLDTPWGSNTMWASSLSSITSLDVSLDCGWQANDQHLLYRRLITHTASTLRELRVVFRSNKTIKKATPETTLSYLLYDLTFPMLRQFEVMLIKGDSSNPKSTYLPGKKGRRQRPNCQIFDIGDFLLQHADTLTRVHFTNVVFWKEEALPTNQRDVPGYIHDTLEILRQSQKVEHVEWIVNRYHHDPDCSRTNEDIMTSCTKLNCGIYHTFNSRPSETSHMEVLAATLDVGLDPQKKAWDFGDYVRRSRQVVGIEAEAQSH